MKWFGVACEWAYILMWMLSMGFAAAMVTITFVGIMTNWGGHRRRDRVERAGRLSCDNRPACEEGRLWVSELRLDLN